LTQTVAADAILGGNLFPEENAEMKKQLLGALSLLVALSGVARAQETMVHDTAN
jgi:hypothetical protein